MHHDRTMLPRASSFFTSAAMPAPVSRLSVTRGAESVVVSGRATITLRGREAMRKVVDALVQMRRGRPGSALSVDEVYAIGWPRSTDATTESRARRVYTMMSRLRRMGLADVIVTSNDGYLVDPRWHVEAIVSPSEASLALWA